MSQVFAIDFMLLHQVNVHCQSVGEHLAAHKAKSTKGIHIGTSGLRYGLRDLTAGAHHLENLSVLVHHVRF